MKEILSVAWIHRLGDKVLCVKSKGKNKYFIPGGKTESNESNENALKREIYEELSVNLNSESITHLFTVHDVAYGFENTMVKMHCYTANFVGEIEINAEIEESSWIGLGELSLCAPAAQIAIQRILKSI